MIVLIGPQSASAAEVLTGALQNRNRAAVVGRTSWGKGSVQKLFEFEDGSKLKLTIALYFTPGGASLQARGVTPDVELVPVPVPFPRRIRLTEPDSVGREADLTHAFAARENPRRSESLLRYLAVTPDGDEEVRIARDLLVATREDSRGATLVRGKAVVEGRRNAEEARITAALTEAGVDWSLGSSKAPPLLSVRCEQRGPPSGDRVPVECEVRNDGARDAFRVLGRADSAAFDLKGEEIVVGRVPSGASRKVAIEGSLAEDTSARVSVVGFAFSEEGGSSSAIAPVRIEVPARPHSTASARPSHLEIRVEGPLETTEDVLRLRADVRDVSGVLDVWVTVSNDSSKLDRRKVAYFSRPADEPLDRLAVAPDVPLRPGLNKIGVCARGKDEERCERVFVYRPVDPSNPF